MRYAPIVGERFIQFNIQSGPFANARLRRAVDLALERSALARVDGNVPASQYIPPSMTGAGGKPVVPLEPDVARARALVRGFHGTVTLTTCQDSNCQARAEIIKASLAQIGLKMRVDPEASGGYGALYGAHWQMADIGWFWDWPDPASFLNLSFDPKALLPPGYAPAHPVPPAYLRMLQAAARLRGKVRADAYRAFATRLERDVTPIAVYASPATPEFFSARMGCQVEQPVVGAVDIGALCVRG